MHGKPPCIEWIYTRESIQSTRDSLWVLPTLYLIHTDNWHTTIFVPTARLLIEYIHNSYLKYIYMYTWKALKIRELNSRLHSFSRLISLRNWNRQKTWIIKMEMNGDSTWFRCMFYSPFFILSLVVLQIVTQVETITW